jgi:molybdopterin/thiamine biosynthesis adenylyltransferase/rhodanese-related sulfurtransferase
MPTFQEYLAATKGRIQEITVEQLRERLASPAPPLLLDVRQPEEVADGRVEGALAIPRGLLETELPRLVPDKDRPIAIYCAGGTRSALAVASAQALGYTNLSSLVGGFGRWKQVGAPFHIPPSTPLDRDPEDGAQPPAAAHITSAELAAALASPEHAPKVVDVREDAETGLGYIDGATLMPRGFLELRVQGVFGDPHADLVLVSSQGARAAWAAQQLAGLGFARVRVLEGGFAAWKAAGHPFHVPRRLSTVEKVRYSRHLLIPEVGEEGQLKLKHSRVLLMGAGGLGSPAAYYLAAAGVGRLGIIDSDVVDRSNLQRQILHNESRIGTPKVESARQTLHELNPDIHIETYNARLTSENALEIFGQYDMVLDGGDNFPTRYLVNDACVRLGIPCVHGSVYRFEGQVTVFYPHQGPCYRCLYPEPPPPEFAPSCAEAGVLGVLPGVVGLLQATEAIKVLLGIGNPLVGRLLHFDALTMKFRELKLRRNKDCPVCGDHPTITEFIDYEQFCNV